MTWFMLSEVSVYVLVYNTIWVVPVLVFDMCCFISVSDLLSIYVNVLDYKMDLAIVNLWLLEWWHIGLAFAVWVVIWATLFLWVWFCLHQDWLSILCSVICLVLILVVICFTVLGCCFLLGSNEVHSEPEINTNTGTI